VTTRHELKVRRETNEMQLN